MNSLLQVDGLFRAVAEISVWRLLKRSERRDDLNFLNV